MTETNANPTWSVGLPTRQRIEPDPPPVLCGFCGAGFTETGTFHPKHGPVHIGCFHAITHADRGVLTKLWALRGERRLVDKTPLITTGLLELANLSQLHRMWTTWTADGQSLWAWLSVNIALWLWLNFYVCFNRDNKFAIWGTAVGICLNTLVILSVIYFRYIA